MAEYIDRNELVGNLDRFAPEHLTPLLRSLIEKQPTADVVEVKYGEWIDDGDCFHCSVCNRTYHLGSLQTIYDVRRCWNYCANCGAKMDEESILPTSAK